MELNEIKKFEGKHVVLTQRIVAGWVPGRPIPIEVEGYETWGGKVHISGTTIILYWKREKPHYEWDPDTGKEKITKYWFLYFFPEEITDIKEAEEERWGATNGYTWGGRL